MQQRPQQGAVDMDTSPPLASGEERRTCRGDGGTTRNSLMSIVMGGGDVVPEASGVSEFEVTAVVICSFSATSLQVRCQCHRRLALLCTKIFTFCINFFRPSQYFNRLKGFLKFQVRDNEMCLIFNYSWSANSTH